MTDTQANKIIGNRHAGITPEITREADLCHTDHLLQFAKAYYLLVVLTEVFYQDMEFRCFVLILNLGKTLAAQDACFGIQGENMEDIHKSQQLLKVVFGSEHQVNLLGNAFFGFIGESESAFGQLEEKSYFSEMSFAQRLW